MLVVYLALYISWLIFWLFKAIKPGNVGELLGTLLLVLFPPGVFLVRYLVCGL